jgi:hypothetical protein
VSLSEREKKRKGEGERRGRKRSSQLKADSGTVREGKRERGRERERELKFRLWSKAMKGEREQKTELSSCLLMERLSVHPLCYICYLSLLSLSLSLFRSGEKERQQSEN